MTRFRRVPGGIRATLDDDALVMLQLVMTEVVEIVQPEEAPPAPADQAWAAELGLGDLADADGETPHTPRHPVLARLFPDGYRDDPEAAGDFRRYTEGELRSAKLENATLLLLSLPDDAGDVLLDERTTQAWLAGINDGRLALGTALGVEAETDYSAVDVDSVDGQRLIIYDWLGRIQGALLDVLLD